MQFHPRAQLQAHDGNCEGALRLARRAAELLRSTDLYDTTTQILIALARVERAAGNEAAADEAVADAIRLHEAKGNVAAVAQLRAMAVTRDPPRLRIASSG